MHAGVIGVGVIGKRFVRKLRDAGHEVTVYDIDEDSVEWARERGASGADSPRGVAEAAETVLLALPGTPEVEATMEDGSLADALTEDHLVIDVTTTLPETSVVCDEWCTERGASFLEAPITGGAPREGFQMMVGGTEADYEAAREVLDVICEGHARIGEMGKATVFKLALQMRYAGHAAFDAEVVEFARDNGVDPRLFNDFLGMDIWEQYFTGDFSPVIEGLGGLAIWDKDIGYAHEVARDSGTAIPLTSVLHEAYKASVRLAAEEDGHASALVKYWLALNDAEDRYD
jgi:3-hydroxyisobutyrate dehydrogenase-like beta-hydroxyacid dehydrogenase